MLERTTLIGETPTNDPHRDDAVARGREAWERRKNKAKENIDDWILIGEAFVFGRNEAMAAANSKKPVGKKYNYHFSHFLQIHGFDDIDSRTRGELFSTIWPYQKYK